jgi:hypothetical protein
VLKKKWNPSIIFECCTQWNDKHDLLSWNLKYWWYSVIEKTLKFSDYLNRIFPSWNKIHNSSLMCKRTLMNYFSARWHNTSNRVNRDPSHTQRNVNKNQHVFVSINDTVQVWKGNAGMSCVSYFNWKIIREQHIHVVIYLFDELFLPIINRMWSMALLIVLII